MKESLKKANSKAMKKANLSFDVDFMIEIASKYVLEGKDKNELAKEISDHYKEPVEKYIDIFKESVFDDFIESNLSNILENNEKLNNKDFKKFAHKQTKQTTKKVESYLDGKLSKEELLNYVLNDCLKPTSLEVAKAYGVNVEDAKFILEVAKSGSLNMVAYAATCEVYKYLMELLEEAALIHKERIEIEKRCNEHIQEIAEYRKQIEELVSNYIFENTDTFKQGLLEMDQAILEGDSDGYIHGNKIIQEALGYNSQFSNQEEFDEFMESDLDFVL